MRLPGHRRVAKEDHRGIGDGQRGPHLVLLARDATAVASGSVERQVPGDRREPPAQRAFVPRRAL